MRRVRRMRCTRVKAPQASLPRYGSCKEPLVERARALLHTDARLIAKQLPSFRNIGKGVVDVGRHHGLIDQVGLLTRGRLEVVDELAQEHGFTSAQVDDLKAQAAIG